MSSEALIMLVTLALVGGIVALLVLLRKQEVKHIEEVTDLKREVQVEKLAEETKDAVTKETDYRVARDRYSQFKHQLELQRRKDTNSTEGGSKL